MPKKQTKKSHNQGSYNVAFCVLAVFVVAALTFSVLAIMHETQKNDEKIATKSDKNTAEIITAVENNDEKAIENADGGKDAGANIKQLMNEEEDAREEVKTDENGKKVANILVNYAYVDSGKLVAGATITNLVETGGKCEYIFSDGDNIYSVTTSTLPNAKNTPCEAASTTKTTNGNWKVTVYYKSNSAEGESEAESF